MRETTLIFPHFTDIPPPPTSSRSLVLCARKSVQHFTCIIPPHLYHPSRLPVIHSCFILPNFIQLIIARNLISILDVSDFTAFALYIFPRGVVKVIIVKQNLPSLVSWVAFLELRLAVSSESLAVALPLKDLWLFSTSRSCREKNERLILVREMSV